MRKGLSYRVALIASLGILAAGCSYRLADLTLVSTRNISMQKIDLTKTSSTGVFEGEDVKHIIIFFPTGMPSAEEAIDRALDKGDGKFMTDAVLYYKFWYIPYIYGRISYTIKGKVHQLGDQ